VHPGAQQRVLDPVEHLRGALPGQLDLDLGPLEGFGVHGRAAVGPGAEGAGGDPVVGDGRDRLPLRVGQRPFLADRGELDDGP
jgi:hypothetical protein